VRITSIFLFLCLGLSFSSTMADESSLIDKLSNRLVPRNHVQGNFRQERHLEFFDTPLVSAGRFTLSQDNGLIWEVVTPAPSTMTMSKDGVRLDGDPIKDLGIGRMMMLLIQAFMSVNFDDLSQNFIIEGEVGEMDWRIRLKPSSSILRKGLEYIEVEGKQDLELIDWTDSSGARTVITFVNIRAVQAEPGADGAIY
jgi:hypothetical protein